LEPQKMQQFKFHHTATAAAAVVLQIEKII